MSTDGTITVVGTGDKTTYRIEVSGTLSVHNDSREPSQDSFSDDSTVVTGTVWGKDDSYNYTGELVDCSLKGDARIVVEPPSRSLESQIRQIIQDETAQSQTRQQSGVTLYQ